MAPLRALIKNKTDAKQQSSAPQAPLPKREPIRPQYIPPVVPPSAPPVVVVPLNVPVIESTAPLPQSVPPMQPPLTEHRHDTPHENTVHHSPPLMMNLHPLPQPQMGRESFYVLVIAGVVVVMVLLWVLRRIGIMRICKCICFPLRCCFVNNTKPSSITLDPAFEAYRLGLQQGQAELIMRQRQQDQRTRRRKAPKEEEEESGEDSGEEEDHGHGSTPSAPPVTASTTIEPKKEKKKKDGGTLGQGLSRLTNSLIQTFSRSSKVPSKPTPSPPLVDTPPKSSPPSLTPVMAAPSFPMAYSPSSVPLSSLRQRRI